MSLSTRLDKIEAAMRGRDGGDPPDEPWLAVPHHSGIALNEVEEILRRYKRRYWG